MFLSFLSPQNHRAHLEKLIEYCEQGVREGAKLVYGGRQVPRPGLFFMPTIFTGVTDEMYIAKEESFGPIMIISEFPAGGNDSNCFVVLTITQLYPTITIMSLTSLISLLSFSCRSDPQTLTESSVERTGLNLDSHQEFLLMTSVKHFESVKRLRREPVSSIAIIRRMSLLHLVDVSSQVLERIWEKRR